MSLEIGTTSPLFIRHESVNLGLEGSSFKLLFASDLHFGWRRSSRAIAQLTTSVAETKPDVILLGGDLVDFRQGLPLLQSCVQQLSIFASVWAIPGNHDQWVGVNQVRKSVEMGGGSWLTGNLLDLPIPGGKKIQIDGSLRRDVASNLRILCTHNPIVFPQAVSAGYALVFAGHLHGCQCVFAERGGRLYPGAWFYRWNGLRFTMNSASLLVSRGVGDTLPIRWNCPREVILCQIF